MGQSPRSKLVELSFASLLFVQGTWHGNDKFGSINRDFQVLFLSARPTCFHTCR